MIRITRFFSYAVIMAWCINVHADLHRELVQSTNKPLHVALWSNVPEPATQVKSAQLVQDIARYLPLHDAFALQQVNLPKPNMAVLAKLRKQQQDMAIYLHVNEKYNGAVSSIDVLLYDLRSSALFAEPTSLFSIEIADGSLQQFAQVCADNIYEKVFNHPGLFTTKIAFVTKRSHSGMQPIYQLEVADVDGKNAHAIVQSYQPILSPAWSPDGTNIAYVSLENTLSSIYVQSLADGKRRKITTSHVVASAPSWSSDGAKLAFALGQNGDSHLYEYTLADGYLAQLTDISALDNEPVWSDHDAYLYFTSNRGGASQVYRYDNNQKTVERVTFAGDYNLAPAKRPDSQSIALVQSAHGLLSLKTFDLETGQWHTLTHDGTEESPVFAPNGKYVMFASYYGGRSVLNMVSTDGAVRWRLPFLQGDVFDVAWSPVLAQANVRVFDTGNEEGV